MTTIVQRCRDIMTINPSFCVPEDSVDHAARIMRDEDVGAVPVVEDAETMGLVGIVTDRDLTVTVIAEGRDAAQVRVDEAMTVDPVVCHPEDDVQDALDSMASHQVRRIPVVDDDGRLVGIIAQADVATRLPVPEQVASVVGDISQPDVP